MRKKLRAITVSQLEFRWRFNEKLVVVSETSNSCPLYVDWGWTCWFEPEGPGPEPCIVTPKFVATAIQFALENGWEPGSSQPSFYLGFENEQFILNDITDQ